LPPGLPQSGISSSETYFHIPFTLKGISFKTSYGILPLPLAIGYKILYNQFITLPIPYCCSSTKRREANMDIIKVSGTSRTSAVAGAIAGVVRENKRAEVQAIGASAINQAVKAMALARGYLANDGFDIIFIPEFVDVQIEEKVRTAIKFTVEPR
jgi:stage V sporulation protein S